MTSNQISHGAPMSSPAVPVAPWTTEHIAQQYRAEIRARFEAENATHRAREAADVERERRDRPDQWAKLVAIAPHYAEPSDSAHWRAYLSSDIQINMNSVRVMLPGDGEISVELIRMFDDTSVAWTEPTLGAEIVDGRARVTISLILVDHWDDERAAAWVREASGRPGTVATGHGERGIAAPTADERARMRGAALQLTRAAKDLQRTRGELRRMRDARDAESAIVRRMFALYDCVLRWAMSVEEEARRDGIPLRDRLVRSSVSDHALWLAVAEHRKKYPASMGPSAVEHSSSTGPIPWAPIGGVDQPPGIAFQLDLGDAAEVLGSGMNSIPTESMRSPVDSPTGTRSVPGCPRCAETRTGEGTSIAEHISFWKIWPTLVGSAIRSSGRPSTSCSADLRIACGSICDVWRLRIRH
jgi:hypothetical protein